jgi:hypothetical protein
MCVSQPPQPPPCNPYTHMLPSHCAPCGWQSWLRACPS